MIFRRKNESPITDFETSDSVGIYKTGEQISVVARPIDSDTQYIIKFDSEEIFKQIIKQSKRKIFEGYFAEIEHVKDGNADEIRIQVTFKDVKKAGALGTPWIKVILNPEYKNVAFDIYHQLNDQALSIRRCEQNTLN